MMEQVELIVSKLNEEPFCMDLKLIQFDEKKPMELLSILINVIESLDNSFQHKHVANSKNVSLSVLTPLTSEEISHLVNCLLILNYEGIPRTEDELEEWQKCLGNGDKKIVNKILYWTLSSYKLLSKRAYLSNYLVPVDIPLEIVSFDNTQLMNLSNEYKNLQNEFKVVHKKYDSKHAEYESGCKLVKADIQKLSEESRQLESQISTFEKLEEVGHSSFGAIYDATIRLRELEESVRINENRLQRQLQKSTSIENMLHVAQRRNQSLTRISSGNLSKNDILQAISKDSEYIKSNVSSLHVEIQTLKSDITCLQYECNEVPMDVEDVKRTNNLLKHLKLQVTAVEEKLNHYRRSDQLTKYHETLSHALDKLNTQQDQVDNISRHIQGMNFRASCMPNISLNENGSQSKLVHDYRVLIEKTSVLQKELNVLKRTQEILEIRSEASFSHLKAQEKHAGLSGYREMQQRLEVTSEETAALDALKEQTLNEISSIVSGIKANVLEKQAMLAPKVTGLKKLRRSYQELEYDFNDKKHRFEKISSGMFAEKARLKEEFDILQEEWLSTDSRYFELLVMNDLAKMKLEKVKLEDSYQASEQRLSPDFQGFSQLYESKIVHQQSLSKTLRKQLRKIQSNEVYNSQQTQIFNELWKFLSVQVNLANCQKSHLSENVLNAVTKLQVINGTEILSL